MTNYINKLIHPKSMKKVIFTFMFMLLLIGTVSAAQDSLGTFKQGEDIELLQICGTCTYNNITSIVYPNSTHTQIDTAMTQRGAEYNYTLTDTEQVGVYTVNGFGDLDGTATAWAYEFTVTSSGHGGVDIIWVIVIALSLAGILIGYGFVREEHPPITIGGILLLVIALYIWVEGFGILAPTELISRFIAAAIFVVGAVLSIKSLTELN